MAGESGSKLERQSKPKFQVGFWPLVGNGEAFEYSYLRKVTDIAWKWEDEEQVVTRFTLLFATETVTIEGKNVAQLLSEIRSHICHDVFQEEPMQVAAAGPRTYGVTSIEIRPVEAG